MSLSIELEIQKLLKERRSLTEVAEHLLNRVESYPDQLSPEDRSSIFRFMINAQLPHLLIAFTVKNFDKDKIPTPWPFFLEALGQIKSEWDPETVQALLEGIQEEHAELTASQTTKMHSMLPQLGEWRAERKQKNRQEYLSTKKHLLEQMITLRTQQLYEQEKKVLLSLQKMYPGDPEILQAAQELKERHALDIIQKKAPASRAIKEEDYTEKDPAVEDARRALMECLQEKSLELPELAFDFAIVAFMLEDYETSLKIIDFCEDSEALWWFKVEVLLLSKRFIQALEALPQIELLLAHEPETFFATAYYRSQCLWGLGQKHAAIETIESLLEARPHYRAASALLRIWSTS